jgi:hypothetical protein
MRLRVVYVYTSRLDMFGDNPTPAHQQTLATIRARVHERKAW